MSEFSIYGILVLQKPRFFFKEGVLKNFAKFAGNHLHQSLFLNEVTGLRCFWVTQLFLVLKTCSHRVCAPWMLKVFPLSRLKKLWTFFEKKLFHTLSFMCILPSFFQNASQFILQKRIWKCGSTTFFRKLWKHNSRFLRYILIRKYKRKVVLFVFYLFNYDSSKSTFCMLNMTFEVPLSTVFVKWIEILRSLQCKYSKNILLLALCFDMYFFHKNLIAAHHGDNSFVFWNLYQIHTFNDNRNDEEIITSNLMCVI